MHGIYAYEKQYAKYKDVFAIPMPWTTYASKLARKKLYMEYRDKYVAAYEAMRDEGDRSKGKDLYSLIMDKALDAAQVREHARCGLVYLFKWTAGDDPATRRRLVEEIERQIRECTDHGELMVFFHGSNGNFSLGSMHGWSMPSSYQARRL